MITICRGRGIRLFIASLTWPTSRGSWIVDRGNDTVQRDSVRGACDMCVSKALSDTL